MGFKSTYKGFFDHLVLGVKSLAFGKDLIPRWQQIFGKAWKHHLLVHGCGDVRNPPGATAGNHFNDKVIYG